MKLALRFLTTLTILIILAFPPMQITPSVFAVNAADCDFTGPDGTPDGEVDSLDIQDIAIHSRPGGVRPGDPLWDPQYDVNRDGIINEADIEVCNGFFGPVPPGEEPSCPGENQVRTAFGCIATDPGPLVTQVLSIAIGVAGGIAFILMVIGAIRMLVSAGDPEALAAGRDMLTSAIVGLLFIIFSVVILRIIGLDILQIPDFLT